MVPRIDRVLADLKMYTELFTYYLRGKIVVKNNLNNYFYYYFFPLFNLKLLFKTIIPRK